MARRPTPSTEGLPLETLPDLDAATIAIMVTMGHFNNQRQVDSSIIPERLPDVQSDEEPTQTRNRRMFSVSKRLVDCDELRRVNRVQEKCLLWLYAVSLPSFLKPGIHRIPVGLVLEVDETLVGYRRQLAEAVEVLCAAWPTRIREMADPSRLGDQWREEDYPTVAELRALFTITWRYLDAGNPDRLQTISGSLFEEQRIVVQNAAQEQAQEIRAMMRSEALAVMTRFRDRLTAVSQATGAPAQIRGAVLDDVQRFLTYEPHRNVTGDRTLSAIMDGIRADLSGVSIDRIRDDEGLRRSLGEATAMAATALESLVQPAQRAIRVRGAA